MARSERVESAWERRSTVEHDHDRPAGANHEGATREYVREATEEYLSESNPVTVTELKQAAAGLVTLLLLGGLLVGQVL